MERIAAALEAVGAKADPPEKEEREKADLHAQIDMAKWAFWMMVASFAAVIVTGVGILLIGITLKETRRAAFAAEGMLKQAEQTTAAAQETIAVTRVNAERQLRAYALIDRANIEWWNDNKVAAHLVIRNSGQTPAKNLTNWVRMDSGDEREFPSDDGRGPKSKVDIGPGTEFNVWCISNSLPPEEWAEVRDRRKPILVWGEIHYDDVFDDEPRTSKFRLILRSGDYINHQDLSLDACGEGNESN